MERKNVFFMQDRLSKYFKMSLNSFFHWAQHRWSSSSFHFRCQSHDGERFLSHHKLCASSESVERQTYRLEVLESMSINFFSMKALSNEQVRFFVEDQLLKKWALVGPTCWEVVCRSPKVGSVTKGLFKPALVALHPITQVCTSL